MVSNSFCPPPGSQFAHSSDMAVMSRDFYALRAIHICNNDGHLSTTAEAASRLREQIGSSHMSSMAKSWKQRITTMPEVR